MRTRDIRVPLRDGEMRAHVAFPDRTPAGAVEAGTTVQLRLRTFHDDVDAVKLRLFSVNAGEEQLLAMVRAGEDASCYEESLVAQSCDYWQATLTCSRDDRCSDLRPRPVAHLDVVRPKRRNRVDHDHVHGPGAHEHVCNFKRLLTVIWLADQELIGAHPELARIDRVERVLGVDEGAGAAATEDAATLGQRGAGVRHVLERVGVHDEVEGAVRERQRRLRLENLILLLLRILIMIVLALAISRPFLRAAPALLADLEHRGIFHAREIVGGCERDAAVDQHEREEMLHADVRHFAPVHDFQLLVRHACDYALDIVGSEAVLLHEIVQYVERTLYRSTDGPALDAAAHDLEVAAEADVVFADGAFGVVHWFQREVHVVEPAEHVTCTFTNEAGGVTVVWPLEGRKFYDSNTNGVRDDGEPLIDGWRVRVIGDSPIVCKVPVENIGGPGTADAHWRESVFDNELMTGFLNSGVANPLSVVSIASLADVGYLRANYAAADPYALGGAALRAGLARRIPLGPDTYLGVVTFVDAQGRLRGTARSRP